MEPQPPRPPDKASASAQATAPLAQVIDDPVLIGAVTLLYAIVQVLASLNAHDCTC